MQRLKTPLLSLIAFCLIAFAIGCKDEAPSPENPGTKSPAQVDTRFNKAPDECECTDCWINLGEAGSTPIDCEDRDTYLDNGDHFYCSEEADSNNICYDFDGAEVGYYSELETTDSLLEANGTGDGFIEVPEGYVPKNEFFDDYNVELELFVDSDDDTTEIAHLDTWDDIIGLQREEDCDQKFITMPGPTPGSYVIVCGGSGYECKNVGPGVIMICQ